MIHLDTNYLIRLLVAGSPQALRVDQWLASGESLAASALAWTEFLNGPVPAPQVALVESFRQVLPDPALAVGNRGEGKLISAGFVTKLVSDECQDVSRFHSSGSQPLTEFRVLQQSQERSLEISRKTFSGRVYAFENPFQVIRDDISCGIA